VGCCEHGDEPSGAAEEIFAPEKGLLSMKSVGFFVSLLVCLFVCQSNISDLKLLPREANEHCNLTGHYQASGGSSLPTFRDNLSVPSSRVKNP